MASGPRPDTEIKLYPVLTDQLEQRVALDELSRAKGLVLKLIENIQGNVFNRPFPYVSIRSIPTSEALPANLKNDGDAFKDYFFTLRGVKRQDQPRVNQL